jgi:hypothetical protein
LKKKCIQKYFFIYLFLVSNSINCFVCDSKEDEHCPETWTRKDLLPVECGGPDGVQDARFCIKTIAVFGGLFFLIQKSIRSEHKRRIFFMLRGPPFFESKKIFFDNVSQYSVSPDV